MTEARIQVKRFSEIFPQVPGRHSGASAAAPQLRSSGCAPEQRSVRGKGAPHIVPYWPTDSETKPVFEPKKRHFALVDAEKIVSDTSKKLPERHLLTCHTIGKYLSRVERVLKVLCRP